VLSQIKIVLVEPSHPGNIGGAARAMKNMGLSQLVIINPRRYPDPQADWRAAGALDILDGAVVVPDVDTAISDCHWVVGTSTRLRKIPWPVADVKEIAAQISQQPPEAKVAIMFGREDSGLTNEELQRCHYHLQIPADEVYPSLNLAMAVQVVCYELYQASLSAGSVSSWDRSLATAEHVEHLLVHIEQTLKDKAFLDADNPGQTMTRLRRLFSRVQLDETEVQILRGVFKQLAK
jgi:tRNA (cytidine32/uridine32-2'-O)-methyltransferase